MDFDSKILTGKLTSFVNFLQFDQFHEPIVHIDLLVLVCVRARSSGLPQRPIEDYPLAGSDLVFGSPLTPLPFLQPPAALPRGSCQTGGKGLRNVHLLSVILGWQAIQVVEPPSDRSQSIDRSPSTLPYTLTYSS
jgi:hypothetical protein